MITAQDKISSQFNQDFDQPDQEESERGEFSGQPFNIDPYKPSFEIPVNTKTIFVEQAENKDLIQVIEDEF